MKRDFAIPQTPVPLVVLEAVHVYAPQQVGVAVPYFENPPPYYPPGQQQVYAQPVPAYVGSPQLPPPDGVLKLTFLPPGCCSEWWACCCCCWSLPQPQPLITEHFKIEIDGVQVGTIRQSMTLAWPAKAGSHTVKVKKAGVAGFLHSIMGSDEVTSTVVVVEPGQTNSMVLGKRVAHCSDVYTVFLESESTAQR